MPLPAGLRALAIRDFRVYFAGTIVSQICNWMQTVTQSWLVLELTDSPFLLGLIATLQFGPILLFSIFAGIVADRLTKRNILMLTQAVQSALALTLGLLVWGGHARYWTVAVMAVMWGVMSALDQPTRQSFIIELVGRQHLASAVGVNSASFNSARIVGPAVAGILIARVGLFAAFMINAVAFLVSIGALTRVPARPPASRAGTTPVLEEIAEGVAYAARTPGVRFILGLQIIVSFCVFNFSVYVPLLARVLGLGSEGFGFLMASLGLGAVTAGLSLGAIVSRDPPPELIAMALGVACAGLLGLAVIRSFWPAALVLGTVGLTGTLVVACCNTSLQLATPDRLRGRIMSLYTLVSGGIFPLSAFFVGSVSQAGGVSRAFAVSGTLGLAALAVLVALRRRRRSMN
ncbi:MAG TPA: MFS transporter [Candidatus Methylomirabilis sp.]|nr:MFS transporter [Candidatus Methylomirabilis sp.]